MYLRCSNYKFGRSSIVRGQPHTKLQAHAHSTSVAMPLERAELLNRVKGALWGVFIADSLSMPVHWYYNPYHIQRDFGRITDYQAPKASHPSSIMSLSNTGGHGRGGQAGRIIGDVINHGKHVFWGKPGMHYHQVTLKGNEGRENSLNALCARVVMRGIAANRGYDPKHILHEYVKFMTTPGSHNDTYAESFHRDFFANYAKGVPPEKCAAGTEGHNTAQIGGFVMLAPVIMASLPGGRDNTRQAALSQLALTHDSRKLATYADKYAGLMYDVSAGGMPLKEAVLGAAKSSGINLEKALSMNYDDVQAVHGLFGSACYIDDSWPVVLYLAGKYSGSGDRSFENAVVANTNVGGENCHRGAALGALMGASLGESSIPARLIEGLHDSAAIRKEIQDFCDAIYPAQKSEL